MRNSIFILSVLLLTLGLSACAKAPVKPVNSPEVQRGNAREAQDELSSGVRK